MKENNHPPIEFKNISLLVHPFFTLEHLTREIPAGGIMPTSKNVAVKEYEFFDIINSWREEITRVKNNPNAILVLVGLSTGKNLDVYKLSKEDFHKFSEEYKSLVTFAKKILGRRCVYITGTGHAKKRQLKRLFQKRNLKPKKRIRVRAFGEYLSFNPDRALCVRGEADYLEGSLQYAFPKSAVTTQFAYKKHGKVYSLQEANQLSAGTLLRESQKRIVTAKFVRKRIHLDPKGSATKLANSFNRMFTHKRGRK